MTSVIIVFSLLINTLAGRTAESGMIGDTRTVISANAAYASANAGLLDD